MKRESSARSSCTTIRDSVLDEGKRSVGQLIAIDMHRLYTLSTTDSETRDLPVSADPLFNVLTKSDGQTLYSLHIPSTSDEYTASRYSTSSCLFASSIQVKGNLADTLPCPKTDASILTRRYKKDLRPIIIFFTTSASPFRSLVNTSCTEMCACVDVQLA